MRSGNMAMKSNILMVMVVLAMASASASASAYGQRSNSTRLDVDDGVTGVNGSTLGLLLTSASRQFTEDRCVGAIVGAKHRAKADNYLMSFPPEGFEPPGARDWCSCLLNGADLSFISPDDPEEFEEVFDRCNGEVLEGSDFNAVDICRGMMFMFGPEMRITYTTFCGQVCRPLTNDSFENYHMYVENGAMDMEFGCESECARDLMPGYCNSNLVTYNAWKSYESYRYATVNREVVVNNEVVAVQSVGDFGRVNRRKTAAALCDVLGSLLGNPNECCNYSKAFDALQICCSLDEDGNAVFDCERTFGGSNLYFDCMSHEANYHNGTCMRDYCNLLVDFDTTPVGESTVWHNNSTDQKMIMFADDDLDNFCSYFGRQSCCYELTNLNFAANCADLADLEYVGTTSAPLEGPTPAAAYEPCHGLCSDSQDCIVRPNGTAFCVNCAAFVKPDDYGELRECCQFDPVEGTCKTALLNVKPGICTRAEPILVMSEDGSTSEAEFLVDEGYVCSNPRDFKVNGAGCRIEVDLQGVATCESSS